MQAVRALLAAVAFLTRAPVGRVHLDGADVARGSAFFPLVGAAIGAAVGGIAAVPLAPLLAAALAVTAGAVLTGALHHDALADTADALGAPTRERALAIMRDHHVGAYGALALALGVALKVAAIAALDNPVLPVVAAAAVARLAPVLLGAALPYARPGPGLGRAVGGRPQAVVALGFAVAIAWAAGYWPLALVPVAASLMIGFFTQRWLGGVTGDVLGAAAEVTEIAALVTVVALT